MEKYVVNVGDGDILIIEAESFTSVPTKVALGGEFSKDMINGIWREDRTEYLDSLFFKKAVENSLSKSSLSLATNITADAVGYVTGVNTKKDLVKINFPCDNCGFYYKNNEQTIRDKRKGCRGSRVKRLKCIKSREKLVF